MITQMETFDEAIVTEKAATLQTFDEAVVTEKAAQINRGRHIRSSRPGCVVLAALHPSSKAAAIPEHSSRFAHWRTLRRVNDAGQSRIESYTDRPSIVSRLTSSLIDTAAPPAPL
jgi:hypothetical protein